MNSSSYNQRIESFKIRPLCPFTLLKLFFFFDMEALNQKAEQKSRFPINSPKR